MVAFIEELDSTDVPVNGADSTPLLDAIVSELKAQLQQVFDDEQLRILAWRTLNEAFLTLDEKYAPWVLPSRDN